MCGLFAVISTVSTQLPSDVENRVDRALNAIQHRGPDARGTFVDPKKRFAFGHVRLSVIDVAATSNQPFWSSCGRYCILFNGEIYNYKQLIEQYELTDLRSNSDTEVICQLLEKVTPKKVLELLNGMFAIALYDSRDRSLLLIRDRLGKKPLWVMSDPDGTLLFASESRALKLNRKELIFRSNSIFEVLKNGYINPPYSTYEEIQQLPPGSFLQWKDGVSKIETYWKPEFAPKKTIAYQDAIEETNRSSGLCLFLSPRKAGSDEPRIV